MKAATRTVNVPQVRACCNKLKVLWSVVVFDCVDVVDSFIRSQKPAKHLFHNKPVLCNVPVAYPVRMFVRSDVDVPVVQVSAFAVMDCYAPHRPTHALFGAVGSGFVGGNFCVALRNRKSLSAFFALFFYLPLACLKKAAARTILVDWKPYRHSFAVFA